MEVQPTTMARFTEELRVQVSAARRTVDEALACDDQLLADVAQDHLADLYRLAERNGVVIALD